jgi:hypothetical protein
VLFRYNCLFLNDKRLMVRFTYLRSKVYDSYLFRFKSYSTSPFLIERLIDNCLDSLPVTLRGWPGHLYSKIIHKSDRSSLAINLSLHEVCVKEKE